MKECKGRQWLIKALVGSHNYNLNTETSDKDYKIFVLPTFDDLFKGEKLSKCTTSEEEDLSIHDIRMLTNMLYKSNVNFIEVLFSTELIINPDLSISNYKMITEIIKNRESYAQMNLPYLWEACIGMYYQNSKKMKYISLENKNCDRLFDSKKAMTAYRILDFLDRYAVFLQSGIYQPFKQAIYYNDDEKANLLYIRKEASLSEVEDLLKNKLEKVESKYKNFYKESKINEKLKLELERDIKKLVYKNI